MGRKQIKEDSPKVLGLDISTKTIGWALFDIGTKNLLELTHVSPRPKDVENKIAEQEKAKADTDAKAKAKAEADAKAKAEAEAKAKMKELNNQLINAKTPEEKARIQAEIDALAGNVANATGSSKTIVYVVVGLAIIGGAYMLLKRKA